MYPPPYIYHTNQQIHLGRPLVSSTLQQIPRREASRLQRGTSGDPHCPGIPKRNNRGWCGCWFFGNEWPWSFDVEIGSFGVWKQMNFMYMLRYTKIRWCGISTLELPYPTFWKRKIHRLKIAGFQGRGIWFTFTFYYRYWEPFPKIHHVSRLANLALPGCQVGTSLDMSPKNTGKLHRTRFKKRLKFYGFGGTSSKAVWNHMFFEGFYTFFLQKLTYAL